MLYNKISTCFTANTIYIIVSINHIDNASFFDKRRIKCTVKLFVTI